MTFITRFFALFLVQQFIRIIVLAFVSALPLFAQDMQNDSTISKSIRQLRADLNAILSDTVLNSAHIGVFIAPAKSKEIIYARNETKSFIPASNMKVYTTAMALEYLGKDFTYTTKVYLDGVIKSDGEYIGNIIVRGSGDPTLSTYFHEKPMKIFEQWASVLDSLGIRSMRGNLIGDDSYFDQQLYGDGWQFDDFPYYYSAPVSSLIMNDNTFDAAVYAGSTQGAKALIELSPLTKYPSVNHNITTDTVTSINSTRDPYTPLLELQGTIKPGRFDSVKKRSVPTIITSTVDNPTIFFLQCFRSAIEERGIKVRGGTFAVKEWGEKMKYSEAREVCSYTSPPLSEIVRVINTHSHNLGAEVLLKTIAKERQGIGGYEQARVAMQELLYPFNGHPQGTSIIDGSGLSRSNLLTPKGMMALLQHMLSSPNKDVFINSLPQPGETGTLRSRLRKTNVIGNLRAKTGTLTGVSSLCGYITTKDKEQFVFSLFFNNYTVPTGMIRNIQDVICMRLNAFSRK